MITQEPVQLKKERNLAITWGISFLILFPLLIFLGLLMRLGQGELIKLLLANFYAFMTLHGLGMAGLLFSISFAAVWYLISTRYTKLNLKVGYFIFFTIIIGFAGLTFGTLIGKFGAGWYMLYPLPFKDPTWFVWSIKISIISLTVLGIAWLTGILYLLYALLKEYKGFKNLLGWQFASEIGEHKDIPPIIFITSISLIAAIPGFIVGIAIMCMYLFQSFEPVLSFNAVLLNNMTFFFGHTLSTVTLYCSIAWVYALLPEFTMRVWKTNKALLYCWYASLFLMLISYAQHLFMNFIHPLSAYHAGLLAAYLSTVPPTVITILGVFEQLYHSKIKWGIIPLLFLLGTAGLAIGGFVALLNIYQAFNKILHNTLWVPAHFHSYTLMGIVLFVLGFLFYLFSPINYQQKDKLAKTGFWIFIAGGYGFILMFYLGGFNCIPRSFARYTGTGFKNMHATAVSLSQISVGFIIVIIIGLLLMYISLFFRLFKKKDQQHLTDNTVY